ncbi:MAG: hypothetical protein AAF511_10695, partial [Pseudomonadota bacterium]
MPEFAAQLTDIAGAMKSATGLGVLAAGVLVALAFAAYIFRDDVPLFKSQDRSFNMPVNQPPRLADPADRMDRARERFWDEGKGRALTTAFQGLAVVAVVVAALAVFNGLKPTPSEVADKELDNAEANEEAPVLAGHLSPESVEPYCEFGGSIDDDFLEFCANRSAVRMDFVRLRVADQFAVEPVWVERTCGQNESADVCVGKNEGSLVSSVDHAAPFVLDASTSTAEAPLTSSLRAYDGYLVVGATSDALNSKIAENRRKALAAFAELQMCGAEGQGCDVAKGKIFSTTASFDAPACPADKNGVLLTVDPRTSAERFANYCNRAARLQKDQKLKKRAADEQLGPELIIIGLKIDDFSPTPVTDMELAARCFMSRYDAHGDLGLAFKKTDDNDNNKGHVLISNAGKLKAKVPDCN